MSFRDSWLPNIVVGVIIYLLPNKKELVRLLFRRSTRAGKVGTSAVAMPTIRPIIAPEQPCSNPAPMAVQMSARGSSGSIGSADLCGDRPPDDGRADFLFDDDDGEYEYLPDMFGLFKDSGAFNVVTDMRSGRVEITQNSTLIASSAG